MKGMDLQPEPLLGFSDFKVMMREEKEGKKPILPHGAMPPATTYIFKGEGSASHPAWASQAAKAVKFRI